MLSSEASVFLIEKQTRQIPRSAQDDGPWAFLSSLVEEKLISTLGNFLRCFPTARYLAQPNRRLTQTNF